MREEFGEVTVIFVRENGFAIGEKNANSDRNAGTIARSRHAELRTASRVQTWGAVDRQDLARSIRGLCVESESGRIEAHGLADMLNDEGG